jgi:hypothetical protein
MTAQTQQAAPVEQGTHHYVLTLEAPGRGSATAFGTWTPPAGSTRHDVFTAIKADMVAQSPEFARANVIFFSIEPNQI